MNQYKALINVHTIAVLVVSAISAFVCLQFGLKLYIDFLIMSIVIAFPITITIRESFKRRERAIQYLAMLKGSLQSMVNLVNISDVKVQDKSQFKKLATAVSSSLCEGLAHPTVDAIALEQNSQNVLSFINTKKTGLNSSLQAKLIGFFSKADESIAFLVATKRHKTPAGLHVIVLLAIYLFAVFYPASLLFQRKEAIAYWHLFALTAFKVVLMVTLFNLQTTLEDPFIPGSPDAIRLSDFNLKSS